MSYRIYVNDKQCLGNGECPKVLIKALNKQGAKIYKSKDYCFHDFEIKELQPIIEALEQYIFDIDNYYKQRDGIGLGNYQEEFDRYTQRNFTFEIQQLIDCGYMFITANFLRYIEGDYEMEYDFDRNRFIYKIKEGHKIYMSGF